MVWSGLTGSAHLPADDEPGGCPLPVVLFYNYFLLISPSRTPVINHGVERGDATLLTFQQMMSRGRPTPCSVKATRTESVVQLYNYIFLISLSWTPVINHRVERCDMALLTFQQMMSLGDAHSL